MSNKVNPNLVKAEKTVILVGKNDTPAFAYRISECDVLIYSLTGKIWHTQTNTATELWFWKHSSGMQSWGTMLQIAIELYQMFGVVIQFRNEILLSERIVEQIAVKRINESASS